MHYVLNDLIRTIAIIVHMLVVLISTEAAVLIVSRLIYNYLLVTMHARTLPYVGIMDPGLRIRCVIRLGTIRSPTPPFAVTARSAIVLLRFACRLGDLCCTRCLGTIAGSMSLL